MLSESLEYEITDIVDRYNYVNDAKNADELKEYYAERYGEDGEEMLKAYIDRVNANYAELRSLFCQLF